MRLSGCTVLITGGASGLGFSLAKVCDREGAIVLICDISKEGIGAARRELPRIHGYLCDVSDPEERAGLVRYLRAEHPDFNVLINNAGVCPGTDFSKAVDPDEIQREIDTNLLAPVDLICSVLPAFLAMERAAIINICSECGVRPFYATPLYSGTKAGLTFFSESLRCRLRVQRPGHRVLISEVFPPTIDTAMNAQWSLKKVHPDVVAEQILQGILHDKAVIWAGRVEWRIYYHLSRWLIVLLRCPRKLVRSIKRLSRGEPINW